MDKLGLLGNSRFQFSIFIQIGPLNDGGEVDRSQRWILAIRVAPSEAEVDIFRAEGAFRTERDRLRFPNVLTCSTRESVLANRVAQTQMLQTFTYLLHLTPPLYAARRCAPNGSPRARYTIDLMDSSGLGLQTTAHCRSHGTPVPRWIPPTKSLDAVSLSTGGWMSLFECLTRRCKAAMQLITRSNALGIATCLGEARYPATSRILQPQQYAEGLHLGPVRHLEASFNRDDSGPTGQSKQATFWINPRWSGQNGRCCKPSPKFK